MDKLINLSHIHQNLDHSMEVRITTYGNIFKEYYRRLMTVSAQEAEEYLADNMGLLDNYYHIFYVAMAAELKKIGKKEASEIMENLAKSYLITHKEFLESRISQFANAASDIAVELIQHYSKSQGD